MNANQTAKVKMFKDVVEYCDENTFLIATVAALQTALNLVKAKLVLLDEAAQSSAVPITGIAADKGNRRKIMTDLAIDVASMVFAYASASDNNTLKAEVDYPEYKLTRLRDADAVIVSRTIHDRAVEDIVRLEDYGITPALLASFLTAIEEFETSIPKPRTAIGKRKTQKANVTEFIREIDVILETQMDKLMSKFRISNPDFYETYFNLREIVDPSTTHTQLKGTITDSADGKPISNAVITITEPSKAATSGADGKYSIKPAPFGKFTVTVTKTGYQSFQAEDITIKVGESTVLNAALESV